MAEGWFECQSNPTGWKCRSKKIGAGIALIGTGIGISLLIIGFITEPPDAEDLVDELIEKIEDIQDTPLPFPPPKHSGAQCEEMIHLANAARTYGSTDSSNDNFLAGLPNYLGLFCP